MGLRIASAPGLHALAGPPAEEDLPRDHHGQLRAVGQFDDGGTRAGDRVAADLVDGRTQRFEHAAQRDVLAERHSTDLLVPVDDVAVRGDHDLRVDEALAVGGVLGDADGDRRADARGLGGDVLVVQRVLERGDVDRVLRPQHEVDPASSGIVAVASRCRCVTSDDGTSSALVALFAAALHGGDAQRLPGGATGRRDEREAHEAQHGEEPDHAER